MNKLIIICNNPSSAGWVVIGKSKNGWKDSKGNPIEKYRHNEE